MVTLKRVKHAAVQTTYSGKPGCMCGCNGNYTSLKRSITRSVNRVNALLSSGEYTELLADKNSVYLEYETEYGNIRCVCLFFNKQ